VCVDMSVSGAGFRLEGRPRPAGALGGRGFAAAESSYSDRVRQGVAVTVSPMSAVG
jgi:hypothetical protein